MNAPALSAAALKSLPANSPFSGIFLLKKCAVRTAKTGMPFYSLELGDRTGTFSALVFSDNLAGVALRDVPEGAVVRVGGIAESYQGRFSPKLDAVEALSEEEVEASGALGDLVESSPEDFDALQAELDERVAAIPDESLRAVAASDFAEIRETFLNPSAAISMHHAYRHGLLEHSCHVARVARALLPLYPQVDPSLAIAGALLHDVGKTVEYTQGLATRKTRAGMLQGHVVLGYRIVRKHGIKNRLAPEILERLEHVVLSHQGELEWGAAALAATPEAVFVSLADNFDAKLGMVQAALRNAVPGGPEFSEYLPGLKSSLLLTPPFPEAEAES